MVGPVALVHYGNAGFRPSLSATPRSELMVLPTPHRYADMGVAVFAGWLETGGRLGFSMPLNANLYVCSVWCLSVRLVPLGAALEVCVLAAMLLILGASLPARSP